MLLSGDTSAYVYEIGGLDTNLSFADPKQRSHINARAQAAVAPECSQRLRAGLPGPPRASR